MEVVVSSVEEEVVKPIKLTRLQSICLDYQFRMQMKGLKKDQVNSSEAMVIVNTIADKFELPQVDSVDQLTTLLRKYKLLGFVNV